MTTTKMPANSKAAKVLQYELSHAMQTYDEARTEYADRLAQGDSASYMAEWHMVDLIERETLAQLAYEYTTDDPDATWDQAVEHFIMRMEESLSHMRGASGSTSGATRLVEQITIATKTKLYAKVMKAQRSES